RFEVIQKYSDPPIETCRVCGSPVHKLMSSPAIQFKGSGWYITDYAKKESAPSGDSSKSDKSDKSDKGDSKSDTKTEGKSEGSSDTKSESKTESKPAAKADTKPSS